MLPVGHAIAVGGDISTNIPGPVSNSLYIVCANGQSFYNKDPSIESFKHHIACLFMTETWLGPNDQ